MNLWFTKPKPEPVDVPSRARDGRFEASPKARRTWQRQEQTTQSLRRVVSQQRLTKAVLEQQLLAAVERAVLD